MSPPEPYKLWGGRFTSAPAVALDALNRSIGVDFRLWPFDVRLSHAWALALGEAGVLTADESVRIRNGLKRVGLRLERGELPASSDEDVHTLVDRLLHEEIGELASKLHTGRSRNDQVATDTRLWCADACERVIAAVRGLQSTLLDRAETLTNDLMPAYTHLQRAQPVSAAHWMLAHFWPLQRDVERLDAARRSALILPLGSGAVAGCAFPVPRDLIARELGFDKLSRNSIDAVSDRDFAAELLFAVGLVAVHLSRLAEDLIIFGSSEFGFVRFGDAFSTGSSMMPQKRNPDALELARGFAARAIGDLHILLGLLKGLPSGYNKDLQDDKRLLFDATDTMLLVLPAVAGALAELQFNGHRMNEALSAALMATDLADYLVTKGVTFRDAHAAVGELVREGEKQGVDLDTLPLTAYRSAHSLFGEDAREQLSAKASVARREIPGGTGPGAVRDQLREARTLLGA